MTIPVSGTATFCDEADAKTAIWAVVDLSAVLLVPHTNHALPATSESFAEAFSIAVVVVIDDAKPVRTCGEATSVYNAFAEGV